MSTILIVLSIIAVFAAFVALGRDNLTVMIAFTLLGLGLLFAATMTAPDDPVDECSPATVEATP